MKQMARRHTHPSMPDVCEVTGYRWQAKPQPTWRDLVKMAAVIGVVLVAVVQMTVDVCLMCGDTYPLHEEGCFLQSTLAALAALDAAE